MSLSVHEAAHAWTAYRLGDPTAKMLGRITLNPIAHIDWIGTVLFPLIGMMNPGLPLFGWAKPVPVDSRYLKAPRRDFAIVAAAGPASNLLLAVLCTVALAVIGDVTLGPYSVRGLLVVGLVTNVVLAVFNMIPVPPLDGGNVLGGLVSESIARMIDRVRPYGFLILVGLMVSGFLGTLMRPIINAVLDLFVKVI